VNATPPETASAEKMKTPPLAKNPCLSAGVGIRE